MTNVVVVRAWDPAPRVLDVDSYAIDSCGTIRQDVVRSQGFVVGHRVHGSNELQYELVVDSVVVQGYRN